MPELVEYVMAGTVHVPAVMAKYVVLAARTCSARRGRCAAVCGGACGEKCGVRLRV